MGFKKGQGATEYLVLLAVVLIVAMVAIALLGFFPGLAGDAKKTQSDAYWRGEARPFSIIEHSQSGDVLDLVVQNTEADGRAINQYFIYGNGIGATDGIPFPEQTYFAAGDKKTVPVGMTSNCTPGNTYEYWVNISFNNSDNTLNNQLQVGTKTLIGKCSG